jgi:hypothetical protein
LRPGLTLIELLVALALTIMVIGATFMIYQTNTRYYYRQQSRLEQIQNLRSALYIIGRDIRMAGDGLIVMGVPKVQAFVPNPSGSGGSWFSYEVDASGTLADTSGLRAIFGLDSATAPDTITVFRTEVESSIAFAQLGDAYTGSSSKLTLADAIPEHAVEPDDVIGLVYGRNAILLTAESATAPAIDPGEIQLASRFRPSGSLPTGVSFPRGSYVYNLRDAYLTTYWVDTDKNNLMARYHHLGNLEYDDDDSSSIIVAPNIEDLQLGYVMNGQELDDMVDELTLESLEANNWVRQIQIGLVSVSDYRDRGNTTFKPVSMFNHAVGAAAADGRLRQVLTGNVYLRNY